MYSAIGGSAAMSASELSAYSLQGHNLCCAKETVDRSVLSLRSPATASGTLARPVAIARHSATSSATSCAAHASAPATAMEEQTRRYILCCTCLNTGHFYGVDKYIELYGPIGTAEEDKYGSRVWEGMSRQLWPKYMYQYQMVGATSWQIGWFKCPEPFSKNRALLPADQDKLVRTQQYYPAIFAITAGSEFYDMACLHIFIVSCKPWKVHPSRVCNTMPWSPLTSL